MCYAAQVWLQEGSEFTSTLMTLRDATFPSGRATCQVRNITVLVLLASEFVGTYNLTFS